MALYGNKDYTNIKGLNHKGRLQSNKKKKAYKQEAMHRNHFGQQYRVREDLTQFKKTTTKKLCVLKMEKARLFFSWRQQQYFQCSLNTLKKKIPVYLIRRLAVWCSLIFSFTFVDLSTCGETKTEVFSVFIDSFKRGHKHTAFMAAKEYNALLYIINILNCIMSSPANMQGTLFLEVHWPQWPGNEVGAFHSPSCLSISITQSYPHYGSRLPAASSPSSLHPLPGNQAYLLLQPAFLSPFLSVSLQHSKHTLLETASPITDMCIV